MSYRTLNSFPIKPTWPSSWGTTNAKLVIVLDRDVVSEDGVQYQGANNFGEGVSLDSIGHYFSSAITVTDGAGSSAPVSNLPTTDTSQPLHTAKYFVFIYVGGEYKDILTPQGFHLHESINGESSTFSWQQWVTAQQFKQGPSQSPMIGDRATMQTMVDAALLAAGTAKAYTEESPLGRAAASVAPANALLPIFVGDNDPRVAAASTSNRGTVTTTTATATAVSTDDVRVTAELFAASYASLSAAVSAVGAANASLVVATGLSVSASLTVPANVTLRFTGAGLITVAAGQTLTVAGAVEAPCRPLFVGLGVTNITGPVDIEPAWYSTGGNGSSASPFTGWESRCQWAASRTYRFSAAFYSYATAPNWALNHIKLVGAGPGSTILKHTGTGYAVRFEGSGVTNPEMTWNVVMEGFEIRSNATASGGLWLRKAHHPTVRNIRFFDVPGKAIMCDGLLVLGTIENIRMSGNEGAWSIIPAYGLHLTDTYAVSFNDIIIEGNSGAGWGSTIGIHLGTNSTANIFNNVSPEGIGGGVEIVATANNNAFHKFYAEANALYNARVSGIKNAFYDATSLAAGGSTEFRFLSGAKGNRLHGGEFAYVTIDPGAEGTQLNNVTLNSLNTNYPGFTDDGTDSSLQGVMSYSNVGVFDDNSLSNIGPRNTIVKRSDASNPIYFVLANLDPTSGETRFALWDENLAERAKFAWGNGSDTAFLATLGQHTLGLGTNNQNVINIDGPTQKVTLSVTGTATATAGAATLNKQTGTITTEALTTAAGATYTLTLTNSFLTAASIVTASVFNGTNAQGQPTVLTVTPGSGSVVIVIKNAHAADAFNGTLKVSFLTL